MELKLEVVIVPVTDVDRAKDFYGGSLGFREDIDVGEGDARAVQMTPPGSQCSIILSSSISRTPPGSVDRLVLVVDDIDKTRTELVNRGVAVGDIFHDAAGGLGGGFAPPEGRAPGADPERRSYASYAIFQDPDGNTWMLQEVTERLPGRV